MQGLGLGLGSGSGLGLGLGLDIREDATAIGVKKPIVRKPPIRNTVPG